MTARDAESGLNPFRAIAAFSALLGQFHAHRCNAAKLVAQTKNVRFGSFSTDLAGFGFRSMSA
jgi:hypothetical protein